jgi:hypothetical protein
MRRWTLRPPEPETGLQVGNIEFEPESVRPVGGGDIPPPSSEPRERTAVELKFRPGDQQLPEHTDGPIIHLLVIEDMRERLRVGTERYGTGLQAFNGRDALRDAYEEALDLAAYLKQAIVERDGA